MCKVHWKICCEKTLRELNGAIEILSSFSDVDCN